MAETLTCGKHGSAEATYVCPHLLDTLQDSRPRGFHWIRDDEDEIQAYCDQCWNATDEEWQDLSKQGPRLLCFCCLENVAGLNGLEMDMDE